MSEFSQKFEETLVSNSVIDLIVNVADKTFDEIIDSDILDGIPILGYLNSLRKIKSNINDYFFAKKIYKFIFLTNDISISKRNKFLRDLEEANQERACDVLLMIIDRMDNTNKIDILSNLIKNKISGNISIDEFMRLKTALEKIPYVDIKNIVKYQVDYHNGSETDSLVMAGLISQSVIDCNEDGSDEYRLNNIGVAFLRYGMKL